MSDMRDVQCLPQPEDPPWVRVDARSEGPRVQLVIFGEADVHTCDQLRDELMAALDGDAREVRLDVSGLSFCGLAGSDVLHDFADEAFLRAVTVEFQGMSPLLDLIYSTFPPRDADYTDRTPQQRARGGNVVESSPRATPTFDATGAR